MGANRKIKTDGNLEIESSQVDINSDIDVTGDVGSTTLTTTSNATVGGTLGVTGQATLSSLAYPTSDGTDGQAIITDGLGNLSFGDVASGGADEITSASDASSYSGTARIIYINTNDDCVFTANLNNRIIVGYYSGSKTFRGNLYNCIFQTYGDVTIENTSTDGSTDQQVFWNVFKSNNITVDASGNTSGNTINFNYNKIDCSNLTLTARSNVSYQFFGNNVFATSKVTAGDATNNLSLNLGSKIVTAQYEGVIDIVDGKLDVQKAVTGASSEIKINSTTYVDGAYAYALVADKDSVKTNVNVIASTDAAQTISTSTLTDVVFEDEELDNTSSYDSSTGIFTAPVKGLYAIDTRIAFGSGSQFDAGELVYVQIVKNSSIYITGFVNESVVTDLNTVVYGSGVSGIVSLDSGDTVKARVWQSSGLDDDLINQNAYNYMHIHKVN